MFDIGHPAHVHFFKNTIQELNERGHETIITTRDKDIELNLLDKYGFKYINIGKHKPSIFGKAKAMIEFDYKIYNITKKFSPDILIGLCSPYLAHVSAAIRKPYISFWDTEDAKLNILLNYPFTDVICTPSCFLKKYGKKQVYFKGYKELAYLHPEIFQPDTSVLRDLGLKDNEPFVILRLISWAASHDIGLKGIKKTDDIIKNLEKYGRVFISSEKELGEEYQNYALDISPDKFHSLLSYASLYIGEGGTVSTEAALLGTPAIHIESNSKGEPTGDKCGNFLELRNKYHMLYFYSNQEEALIKATEILDDKSSKANWQKKREDLLRDKINVSRWMTDFIDNYPESHIDYKNSLEEN